MPILHVKVCLQVLGSSTGQKKSCIKAFVIPQGAALLNLSHNTSFGSEDYKFEN